MREFKGKSLRRFVDSYVVLAIESTSWVPQNGRIIEVSGIKVKDGVEIDRFFKQTDELELDFGLNYYGGVMPEQGERIEVIIKELHEFIGDCIIVGHNVHYPVNFIYDASINHLGKPFKNDHINLRVPINHLNKEIKDHQLSTYATFHDKEYDYWSSMSKCELVHELYEIYRDMAELQGIKVIKKTYEKGQYKAVDLRTIKTDHENFDEEHILYEKKICITGKLTGMTKEECIKNAAYFGAQGVNGVSRNTDILVVGYTDYKEGLNGHITNKMKRAQELQREGTGIEIMSEEEFMILLKKDD